MSHHRNPETGRHWVECDDHPGGARCGRKSRTQDRPVSMWDLAAGWWVAPYPDGFAHTDGLTGDRHTCPRCDRLLSVAGGALQATQLSGGPSS